VNPSRYRILEKLGDGGMGVVYKAEDTRLARLVALKFLPPEVEQDQHALERFHREAQAASALNNRHICTVYDIGDQDGRTFIAMELIDGKTLKARMASAPIPLDTTIAYAMQIAEGLDAAHKKGIVHRDIKPSNIFVTRDDEIKLADFGLAKRLSTQNSGAALNDQTVTVTEFGAPLTGSVVGTIAYMSPEQAQGNDVDARSDIFSLGIVIHEMLTGERPFHGDSTAALLGDILRGEPRPLKEFHPETPDELQRIASKALEKDRADRYQTAADLMVDLRRLKRHSSSASHGTITPKFAATSTQSSSQFAAVSAGEACSRRWLWLAVGAVAALVLAIALNLIFFGTAPPEQLEVDQLTYTSDSKSAPIFTDATRLYFNEAAQPVEMSVTGGATVPSRASLGNMQFVDISPDGSEWLAMKRDLNDGTLRGTLWTMPILGGAPRKLSDTLVLGGSYSPDGRSIAYTENRSVGMMDRDGSNPREVFTKSVSDVLGTPRFSPDSKFIRFAVQVENSAANVLWQVGVDGKNPHQLDFGLSADEITAAAPMWTPDGKHFVFVGGANGTSVIRESVEPPAWQFWKKPSAPLISPQKIDVTGLVPSRDSSRLFVVGRLPQASMMEYDSAGEKWTPFLGGLSASEIVLSPDKKWIAFTRFPQGDLWRARADGSERLQLTTVYAMMPSWSPDSAQIAYTDYSEIYKVSIEGGPAEKLTSIGHTETGPTWSPDGKSIYFSDFPMPHPDFNLGIKIVDLATRKVSLMPHTATYHATSWSPDGKWMLAVATPPKRFVLYSAKTGKWTDLFKPQNDWGFCVWSPDSKAVYIGKGVPDPGQVPGVYRLGIPDGKWSLAASFEGLNEWVGLPPPMLGLTPEGHFVYMNDASAVQIYSMKWPTKK
jgi:serine/threonine protein kinase/Tol biopolymer transport system component